MINEGKSQADEAFEVFRAIILAGADDAPRSLQLMVDVVVAMQEIVPMPENHWIQFVADIEYINEKHGLNLTI